MVRESLNETNVSLI